MSKIFQDTPSRGTPTVKHEKSPKKRSVVNPSEQSATREHHNSSEETALENGKSGALKVDPSKPSQNKRPENDNHGSQISDKCNFRTTEDALESYLKKEELINDQIL